METVSFVKVREYHSVFSLIEIGTTKWYKVQALTSLGAEQNRQVGSAFRDRYLSSSSEDRIVGISEDKYMSSQVFASAPDQGILLNTATAFLQGFYPPLEDINPEVASQELNNGSTSTSPLGGYQYVILNGVNDNSPDTVWIKGDDSCPEFTKSSKAFSNSEEFKARDEATREFYESFYDVLSPGVYNLKPEDMSYGHAYDIFDLINVAKIYNATSPARNVSDETLSQLRTLADSAEHGKNYNSSEMIRSIGAQTLSGVILRQLNETVASGATKPKFSLLSGSYDTFLAFFGISGLLDVSTDFYGLPEYASAMTFELFTEADTETFPSNPDADLRVRWLFRNGTAGSLTEFPLFGTEETSLPWARFVSEIQKQAITDVGDWCTACASTAEFCAAYKEVNADTTSSGKGKTGLSTAVAGVIGAVVTLGVVGFVAIAAFFWFRKQKSAHRAEKASVRSGSTSEAPSKV